MSIKALQTNYNPVGVDIMERMYGADYLSSGGIASTDTLADAAKLQPAQTVVDLGCGIGGPAMHLVEQRGCAVIGVDLMHNNLTQARRRAQQRGITHGLDFLQADITNLPLPDASADVIWSQDAWCHVTDKDALLEEAKRVLKQSGRLAFTDWLISPNLARDTHERLLDAAASPAMATQADYVTMLQSHGFNILTITSLSDDFSAQYAAVMARLDGMRDALAQQFSPRVLDIVMDKNTQIRDAFAQGHMSGIRVIANLEDA